MNKSILPSEYNLVLFFDGVCILCNRAFDFFYQRDKEKLLKYSALQSEFATSFLSKCGYEAGEMRTVYFYMNGTIYSQSRAIGKALQLLGGVYKVLGTLIVWTPAFISNAVYDLIARNRYAWFGKKDNCRFPTEEEKLYFLG